MAVRVLKWRYSWKWLLVGVLIAIAAPVGWWAYHIAIAAPVGWWAYHRVPVADASVSWQHPATIMPGVILLPATNNIAIAGSQDLTVLTSTGQVVWNSGLVATEQYWGICGDAAGNSYTGAMPGPVQAHAPDGTLLWEYRVPDTKYTIAGCGPDGVVVAVSSTKATGLTETLVQRLDSTGTPLNSFKLSKRIANLNPVVINADSVIYLFSFQQANVELLAVAPDGAELWTHPIALPARFAASMKPHVQLELLGDGGLVLAAEGVGVHAVNPDGTARWSFRNPHVPPAKADQVWYSIAKSPDGGVYISSGKHVLAVAADGTTLWDRGIGQLAGAVVTGGDMIYVQAYRLSIDMRGGSQLLQRLWRNAVGPPDCDFLIAGLTATGTVTNYWQIPDGFFLLQGPGADGECYGYVATGTGMAAPADFMRLDLPR